MSLTIRFIRMSLVRQDNSNSGMRQHVDQRVHRELICTVVCEMADPWLAHAKPRGGLGLRQPSRPAHFSQPFHQD
jgi:hypothetical protein